MKNTIAERILDFIKNFPPFDSIEKEELLEVCKKIEVIYLEKGKVLFSQNQQPHKHFYLVKEGAVGLYSLFEEEQILIDICDEGDLFGLRPMIQKDSYRLSAKAKEESIVYAIPVDQLKEIGANNKRVSQYILSSFSSNLKTPYATNTEGELFAHDKPSILTDSYFEYQKINYSKNPIHCDKNTSIQEAATEMSRANVGSILVAENNKPIGIVTDKDLRRKVATAKHTVGESITKIMTAPVITASKDISTTEVQIMMMKHKIKHVCITQDGSDQSQILGIVSEHDIVVSHANTPSVLIKEINRTTRVSNLVVNRKKATQLIKNYLNKGIPIAIIANIISEINEVITQKAIAFSLEKMPAEPPVSFAWLALGSQGRKEQLLLTDQDNALVFDTVNKLDLEKTRSYFIELATSVTRILNQIGYEYCPADMMASNPKYCLSISEWNRQFDSWIRNPSEKTIMLCTIFFDYNRVYGDKKLVSQISKGIFKSIQSFEIFLNYLGRNALLNPPPMGFFRQFIVEQDGEHKDRFDIKRRALLPIIDAARLLVLSENVEGKNNTIARLEKMAQLEPQNSDLYLSCIDSFKILLKFRTKEGFKNSDSGRYVNINDLTKSEKLQLKSCFKPIKDIQELIQIRFNLAQMM